MRRRPSWRDQAIATRVEYLRESEAKNDRLVVLCRERLAEVEEWEPPTADHRGLRDLMVQQLTDEIKREVDSQRYSLRPPERVGGAGYRAQLIVKALSEITYHSGEYQKDQERAQDATEWIAQLRKSLND